MTYTCVQFFQMTPPASRSRSHQILETMAKVSLSSIIPSAGKRAVQAVSWQQQRPFKKKIMRCLSSLHSCGSNHQVHICWEIPRWASAVGDPLPGEPGGRWRWGHPHLTATAGRSTASCCFCTDTSHQEHRCVAFCAAHEKTKHWRMFGLFAVTSLKF